jgi:hypothetical protein
MAGMTHGEEKAKPLQFGVKTMLVGILAVFVCFRLIEQVVGHAVPKRLLRQVETGMSEQEVVQVLGEPLRIQMDGDWEYSRVGNQGYVEIGFQNGIVVKMNDESVYP